MKVQFLEDSFALMFVAEQSTACFNRSSLTTLKLVCKLTLLILNRQIWNIYPGKVLGMS